MTALFKDRFNRTNIDSRFYRRNNKIHGSLEIQIGKTKLYISTSGTISHYLKLKLHDIRYPARTEIIGSCKFFIKGKEMDKFTFFMMGTE